MQSGLKKFTVEELNSFHVNTSFLYPLETSENFRGFVTFAGGIKWKKWNIAPKWINCWNIGAKWVNGKNFPAGNHMFRVNNRKTRTKQSVEYLQS